MIVQMRTPDNVMLLILLLKFEAGTTSTYPITPHVGALHLKARAPISECSRLRL